MFTFLYAFEIEFTVHNKIFTAQVHKVPSENHLVKEYHVFHIRPTIASAPSSMTFVYYPKQERFDYKVFHGDVALSKSISTAIKSYCMANDIQLA
ncbi:MAG: hypothetical protein ABI863_00575 [Ginsengibacter sp.]